MVSCRIELGLKGFRKFLIRGNPDATILSIEWISLQRALVFATSIWLTFRT
ncbi:MAG TPA: hypothetical protein VIH22_06130 [Cyclobacteriaceae bacterium]